MAFTTPIRHRPIGGGALSCTASSIWLPHWASAYRPVYASGLVKRLIPCQRQARQPVTPDLHGRARACHRRHGPSLLYAAWMQASQIEWLPFCDVQEAAEPTPTDTLPRETGDAETMQEVHCQCCGSHPGHIDSAEGDPLHGINETNPVFDIIAE